MRYYMIDRVLEFVPGERAVGIKAVTFESEVLHDHFPGYPILPGTMLVEGMAQLSGFLIEMTINRRESVRRAILVKIEEAKFHNMAEPGDCITIEARMGEQLDDAVRTSVRAAVGEKKIATATLMFALREIPFPAIHEQRRNVYQIWTRQCANIPEIL
jgi:3-hydroxyacyl-[acyl-carrier-protein] dehydratase